MEQEFENTDSTNGEENVDSTNNETDEVDVEAIKKENAALKQTNQELYERERKAKGYVRGTDGKWIKPEVKSEPKIEAKTNTSTEYSLQDIRALSDVHDDDVAEVVEFAKFKGISIAEAKKHPAVKALLETNKEFRATEAAKNSGKGKPGASRTTDAQLVEQAASGQLPDDDEGITRLAEARQAEKLAKLQK